MRKLFRFKYEPCNGTCYAWDDVLPEELNKYTPGEKREIIGLMVKAHMSLCDNPDYSFGIDLDESTRVFVAHFRTPKSTETFASLNSFRESVHQVCTAVLSTQIPVVEGGCTYGDNGAEDLGTEILRACTDVAYREAHPTPALAVQP